MNFLFFQLKRLLLLPFNLLASPDGIVRTLWRGSGKGRALLLGLPSILFASLGVAFLCWANFGIADSLENRYKADTEKSAKEKVRLVNELRREVRMLQASQTADSEGALIPDDDPRRVELEEWRSREEVYLEKLIELNPGEPEYLFQLATVSFEQGNRDRGLALMNLTAPLEEPGYIKGHLWLSKYYMALQAKSRQEALQNVSLSLNHADQCLKRDQNNIPAKKLKARILYAQRDYTGAYGIFQELFDVETQYFKPLVEINKRLKKEQRSVEVLEKAIIRFRQQLRSGNLNEAEHVRVWTDLVYCYVEKKDFMEGEQALLSEIERLSERPEDSAKRVWSERLLASVYLRWISVIDQEAADASAQRLQYLKKAYQYDPTNSIALRELTRLGANQDSSIAQEARSIYDAESHPEAPAIVLNELGSQALSDSQYESALRYFEMARKKAPKNPEILNNLAYTYTVIDVPNPKRGLKLIDEALRYLPAASTSKGYLSYFHHTRGQTLMQLGRMTEAAAEFEFALRDRPNNRGILEAIVKCYSASGLNASAFVERLRMLDEGEVPDN